MTENIGLGLTEYRAEALDGLRQELLNSGSGGPVVGVFAPVDASYIVLGASGDLTSERILTEGTGIDLVDNGAGSTLVISVDVSELTIDHGGLTGLGDDDHPQYALLLGRSGDRFVMADDGTTPPWQMTARSAPPTTPLTGDIYLDDGTNTTSGNPGLRRYTGAAWEDIGGGGGGGGSVDGWIDANETWTYSAWDDTNGVSTATITVPSDATTKYQEGMRVKFTQPTDGTKYGIITKVETTTLTVLINNDYDFDNEAISDPFYSAAKVPLGFDLSEEKYGILVTDTNSNVQASPVQNQWYNSGSISADLPIGLWKAGYTAHIRSIDGSPGSQDILATLSDASASESDADFTRGFTANDVSRLGGSVRAEKLLALSTKDTYYLNIRCKNSGLSSIAIRGDLQTTRIFAVCAYL